jgi:hypothetical protein
MAPNVYNVGGALKSASKHHKLGQRSARAAVDGSIPGATLHMPKLRSPCKGARSAGQSRVAGQHFAPTVESAPPAARHA